MTRTTQKEREGKKKQERNNQWKKTTLMRQNIQQPSSCFVFVFCLRATCDLHSCPSAGLDGGEGGEVGEWKCFTSQLIYTWINDRWGIDRQGQGLKTVCKRKKQDMQRHKWMQFKCMHTNFRYEKYGMQWQEKKHYSNKMTICSFRL